MFRVRHWLSILAVIAVGCGGRSPDEDDEGVHFDASATDIRSERADSAPADGRLNDTDSASLSDADASPPLADISNDARDGGALDASTEPASDAAIDARDASFDRGDGSAGPDGKLDAEDTPDARGDHVDVALDANPAGDGSDAPSLDTSSDADAGPPYDDAQPDAAPPVDSAPDSIVEGGVDGGADGADGCTVACGLVALFIFPTNPTVYQHSTRQFHVTGAFADNSTRDLTTEVHWATSQSDVAVVSNAPGTRGLMTVKSQGATSLEAELAGVSASIDVQVATADPYILAVEPPILSIAQWTRSRLTTTVTISDGTTQNDTWPVSWQSSTPAVATVDADGIVTALAPGMTTISATLFSMTGTMTLTVTPATLVGITVAPSGVVWPVGVVQRAIATGHFSDASTQDLTLQATWSSSDTNRATVEQTPGFQWYLSALAPGQATITATVGAISGSGAIAISTASLQSVTISLPTTHLVVDMRLPHQATGHYSDGSTADITDVVTWASLDTGVASTSNRDVYAEQEGATSITASYGNVVGTIPIDVRAAVLSAIDVSPAAPTVAIGASVSMQAVGHYSDGTVFDLTPFAGWHTSAPAVAAIANAEGKRGIVTGLTLGTSDIGATYGGTGAATTATVSP